MDRFGSTGANRAERSLSFEPMHGKSSNRLAAPKDDVVVQDRQRSTDAVGRRGDTVNGADQPEAVVQTSAVAYC